MCSNEEVQTADKKQNSKIIHVKYQDGDGKLWHLFVRVGKGD